MTLSGSGNELEVHFCPTERVPPAHSSVVKLKCHLHRAFLLCRQSLVSSSVTLSYLGALYLELNKVFCDGLFTYLLLQGGDEVLRVGNYILMILYTLLLT